MKQAVSRVVVVFIEFLAAAYPCANRHVVCCSQAIRGVASDDQTKFQKIRKTGFCAISNHPGLGRSHLSCPEAYIHCVGTIGLLDFLSGALYAMLFDTFSMADSVPLDQYRHECFPSPWWFQSIPTLYPNYSLSCSLKASINLSIAIAAKCHASSLQKKFIIYSNRR